MSDESLELSTEQELPNIAEQLQKAGLPEEVVKKSADTLESEAKAKGWRPDGPKTAKEFLDDEPFFKELKARGKEIKELKAMIEQQNAHFEVERRAGYQEALEDLRRQRSDAIALGDEKTVNALDHQIKDKEAELPKPPSLDDNPALIAFKQENAFWLNDYTDLDHAEMNTFIMNRCQQLNNSAIKDPEEAINLLRKDLHKKFPHKFNKEGEASGMVGTISDARPTNAQPSKKKHSFKDLNDVQKEVCRNFVKRGAMTEERYIDSLVKSGELK